MIRKKDYAKAMAYLSSMWEIHEAAYGLKHESVVKIYTEMAKVYNL
jgi:hypothetical protein